MCLPGAPKHHSTCTQSSLILIHFVIVLFTRNFFCMDLCVLQFNWRLQCRRKRYEEGGRAQHLFSGVWTSIWALPEVEDTHTRIHRQMHTLLFCFYPSHLFILFHLFFRIMMLSVLQHTKTPIKFWFLKNYLSPSFKVKSLCALTLSEKASDLIIAHIQSLFLAHRLTWSCDYSF